MTLQKTRNTHDMILPVTSLGMAMHIMTAKYTETFRGLQNSPEIDSELVETSLENIIQQAETVIKYARNLQGR